MASTATTARISRSVKPLEESRSDGIREFGFYQFASLRTTWFLGNAHEKFLRQFHGPREKLIF